MAIEKWYDREGALNQKIGPDVYMLKEIEELREIYRLAREFTLSADVDGCIRAKIKLFIAVKKHE